MAPLPRVNLPSPASAPSQAQSTGSASGSTPSPGTADEIGMAADRARSDLLRVQQQNENLAVAFRGIGQTAEVFRKHLDQIARTNAFIARDEGQTDLVIAAAQWEEGILGSQNPDRAFTEYWRQFDDLKNEIATGITHGDEQRAFLSFANELKRQRFAHTMSLTSDRVREIMGNTFTSVADTYIKAGDIEALEAHIKNYVDNGYLDAAFSQRGNAGYTLIREAAINGITAAAERIYETDGLEAARQWVLKETNHPSEVTGEDLRSIEMNIRRHAESVQTQVAERQNQQIGVVADQQWKWKGSGYAPSPKELDDLVDDTMSDWSLSERSAMKIQLYEFFGIDQRRKAEADALKAAAEAEEKALADLEAQREAYDKNYAIAALDMIGQNLSVYETPHFQQVVLLQYAGGNISDADKNRMLGYAKGEIEESKQGGHQFIDDFVAHIRLANAAGERGLTVENIRGTQLYDDKDQHIPLSPLDGSVLDTITPDGATHTIALYEMASGLKAEFDRRYQEAIEQGGVPDVAALATQVADERLKQLMPGRQLGEAVDLSGNLIYQGETVFLPGADMDPILFPDDADAIAKYEQWFGKKNLSFIEAFDRAKTHERAWFSDAYAVQVGIDFLGRGGSYVPSAEVATMSQPIGDAWTGRAAIVQMGLVSDNEGIGAQVSDNDRELLHGWQQAMSGGQYTLAAAFAAELLPRTAAELDAMVESGALASYRATDGGFLVKFTPAGLAYPVYSDEAPPPAGAPTGTMSVGPTGTTNFSPIEQLGGDRLDTVAVPGEFEEIPRPETDEAAATATEPGATTEPPPPVPGEPQTGEPPAGAPPAGEPEPPPLGADATRRRTGTDEQRITGARVRAATNLVQQYRASEIMDESAAVQLAREIIRFDPDNQIVNEDPQQLIDAYENGEYLEPMLMYQVAARYLRIARPDEGWLGGTADVGAEGADDAAVNPMLFERAFQPTPRPGTPSAERVEQARVNAAIKVGLAYRQGSAINESDMAQIAQAMIDLQPRNWILTRRSMRLLEDYRAGKELDRTEMADLAAQWLNLTHPGWHRNVRYPPLQTRAPQRAGQPEPSRLVRVGDRSMIDHPLVARLPMQEKVRLLGLNPLNVKIEGEVYAYIRDEQNPLPQELAPYVKTIYVFGDQAIFYLSDIPAGLRRVLL